MKKLKKKVLKGMTLMEIIIAIAIVAVMTVILVGASTVINNYIRSANDVNDRVAIQAPVAQANDIGAAGQEFENGIEIILEPSNIEGSIPLAGRLHAVYDEQEMQDHTNEFGRGLNMKFITDIETTTAAPVPSNPHNPLPPK
ncbi:MAG: prepilin-type N-terminal cleavage/methylation domain-containing protein [Ruminococcus sp.]|nr:prepilin-type N-terminal cleavage/methylation domain-containing protein [Ruminococcus sp.]